MPMKNGPLPTDSSINLWYTLVPKWTKLNFILYFDKPLGVNCASQRWRLIGCGLVVRSS